MDAGWWRSLADVDDDQKALYTLPVGGRYLVVGPPGCGKTNVLVLRARYLTRAGDSANLRLLSFARTLTEFIKTGVGESSHVSTNVVSTVYRWMLDLHRAHAGIPLDFGDPAPPLGQRRLILANELLELISLGKLPKNHFDALLVDEVQDLLKEEVNLMGLLAPNLFFAGDSRQRIYKANEGIDAAVGLGCASHKLKFHYRMGEAICRAADKMLSYDDEVPLLENFKYDEKTLPSRAELHRCDNVDEQFNRMLNIVDAQLKVYPNQMIGLLVSDNKALDWLASKLFSSDLADRIQIHRTGERVFESDRPVNAVVVHSAKGTEFRAVHLLRTEEFGHRFTRELGFTAITRAKTSLDVYYTGAVDPSWLSALTPPHHPDPAEVF